MQLAEQAKNMKQHADNIALIAAGKTQQIAGTIRITASEMIAIHHLPQAIKQIAVKHPEIQFEIIANNQSDNLLEREADIAIRMYQPDQDDLIIRKVNDLELGIFVDKSYPKYQQAVNLDEHNFMDIFELDMIGHDRSNLIIAGFKKMGIKYKGKDINLNKFNIRSNSHEVILNCLTNGLGISFQVVDVCQNNPNLTRILPHLKLEALPIWLTAHKEVKTSRRIRLVYDALCAYFANM